ncbi:MAG TPA: hypothetical protein VLF41_02725 [Candidatus Nanoarchaeia archaeon]|nr:hypothetical protein [Candidatus Nanoarchaeia archaeon]
MSARLAQVVDILPPPMAMTPYQIYDEIDRWLGGNEEALRAAKSKPFHRLQVTLLCVRNWAAKQHRRQMSESCMQPIPETLYRANGGS